ncbi:uncharacterized protein METZ01_LOCUS484215, partial [marine metagenome]
MISSLSYANEEVINDLFGVFSKTELKFKIVSIAARPSNNPKKFYIVWWPSCEENILKDAQIITKTVVERYPKTKLISLRAIHPKYMRWSKYSIWNKTIVY